MKVASFKHNFRNSYGRTYAISSMLFPNYLFGKIELWHLLFSQVKKIKVTGRKYLRLEILLMELLFYLNR